MRLKLGIKWGLVNNEDQMEKNCQFNSKNLEKSTQRKPKW